jgi:hypothetical protein
VQVSRREVREEHGGDKSLCRNSGDESIGLEDSLEELAISSEVEVPIIILKILRDTVDMDLVEDMEEGPAEAVVEDRDTVVVEVEEKEMEEEEAGKCPVIETTLHFSFVETFHGTG